MTQNVKVQIENINKSLAWIEKNKPEEYNKKFLQLVENRRTLYKILGAAENNPGIAAFGKSQVGKSYLISCLLQGKDENGKSLPFEIKAGSAKYNFVKEINPPSQEGGGLESTGVVSRFSSFKRNPTIYNQDLPVLVKAFSVADLLMIMSDSYFNDFSDYSILSDDEIKERCEEIEKKYANSPKVAIPLISADEILNIKNYFTKHINNAQSFSKSSFFDRLALLIERIPETDYVSVFSDIWHRHDAFNDLFNHLMSVLRTIGFARYIYLPVESVLHNGVRENTIMSVQCLKQLFSGVKGYATDVYVLKNGQYQKAATNMPKSDICAICSEVVFKIDESFLSSSRPYAWENMDSDVQRRITHDDVKMEILEKNDLLDFPGAKAREQEELGKLEKEKIAGFFLRGKVAYLFNKYNEEMSINILLYCHHNKDSDVTNLYKLLEDWVHNYVGKTPEARAEKIRLTHKSPLFYIGTMFNLDMQIGVDEVMSEMAIDQRWIGRFDTVLNKQCFHRETTDWVKNWTKVEDDFKNSYVLRDYKFSKDLFDGLDEHGKETSVKMTDSYYKMMRDTFTKNVHVKNLFADPALSWDVATTMNNDGALYIIENLADVASRMDEARESDFKKGLQKACENVNNIMKDYYVSTDADEILETNIRKAKMIFREMDFTCNTDNYYFGHLLQGLQMTETSCYRVIHKLMQSPEINSKVNDFRDYEIIRNSCKRAGHPIEQASSEELKWQCLISTYGYFSKEEAEEYLEKKNVDYKKLFSGSYKRKMNSYILADAVFEKWADSIKSVDFTNEFTSERTFDGMVMDSLIDNIVATAERIKLRDVMAGAIEEYVNVVAIHTANESLLADILASTINDYVMDLGYSYMSEDDKSKTKVLCEKRNIPAFNYIEKALPSTYDEAELAQLFDSMMANPSMLLPSFDDNYNKWIEYMFISFVAHLDMPDFDSDANNSLGEILESFKCACNSKS